MNLFDKLSAAEKTMALNYIDSYASYYGHRTASLEHILRIWNAQKEKLCDMFGGKLILSKQVSIRKGTEELSEDIDKLISRGWNEPETHVHQFIDAYHKELVDPLTAIFSWSEARKRKDLIDSYYLATNIYDGETFEIPTNDKPIKVQSGCKVTKILGKIAAAFDLPYFEEFRVAISQVLNQKALSGNLNLSIHPLDFMTMSDNNSGWTSCMSWDDSGCYRQGTVEMMNSPVVVVAYLTGSSPMSMPGKNPATGCYDFTWANKKWRELFIVTPEIISNVKGYPYRNENLSKTVIEWLRELATASGMGKYTNTVYQYDPRRDFEIPDLHKTVHFDPITNMMYNDFDDGQYAAFGEAMPSGYFELCYSGDSECMLCGDIDCNFDGEGALAGECCENSSRCTCCEERYSEDELIYVDGDYLCEGCCDQYCVEDAIDGELHYRDNMNKIYLAMPDETAYHSHYNIYIHDSNLYENILSEYFTAIHTANIDFSHVTYVTIDDCTEKGLDLFGYWGDNRHEQALQSFKDDMEARYSPYHKIPQFHKEPAEELDELFSTWQLPLGTVVDFKFSN